MFGFTEKQRRTVLLALGWFVAGLVAHPILVGTYRMVVSASLYEAIEKGDTAKVQTLLRWGANPNDHNLGLRRGTPLTWATEKSDLKMMKLLIDSGARVNEKDVGATPLMLTSTPQAARLLLDRGANPRLRNDQTGLTAWQGAKYGGSKEIAKILMEYENHSKSSFTP